MSCGMSPAPEKSEDAPRDTPANRIPEDNGDGPPVVVLHVNFESDSEISENEAATDNDSPLENDGYQLLSTDPNVPVGGEADQFPVSWDTATEDAQVGREEIQTTPSRDDPDLVIAHQPRWESVALDADKVEDIKSRMATFMLPPCQHPAWALEVSEDDWKEHLLDKIWRHTTDDMRKN